MTIDQIVAGGDGLGRFEGIPIFVPRAAPGDHLRVRLTVRRPDYGRAEIVDILKPGPGRRTPPCPHFERCGGCDLQHLDDELQLVVKAEAVRETFRRVGKIEMPSDVAIVAGRPWGYRSRAQLHVEPTASGGAAVGYFARGSHDLVAVDRCPVLAPDLEALLPRLPQVVGDGERRRLDLALGDDGALTCAPVFEGLPSGPIQSQIGDFTYHYDARCFFQGHRDLVSRLVELAVGPWEAESAFDLYAGVGLFTLPLAARHTSVVAVEGDRIAARYARKNARENRMRSIEVEAQSVDGWIEQLPAEADRVIVDPPRGGLSPRVRQILYARRPRRLTYVSCHPATLARDLRILCRNAAYTIEQVALFDLFPQTGHMEAVVQLVASDEESP